MINGLAQQYLLDLIQPYISNKHAYTGLMAKFTVPNGLHRITLA